MLDCPKTRNSVLTFKVTLNVEVMNQVTDLPSVECSKTKTNLIIYQLKGCVE